MPAAPIRLARPRRVDGLRRAACGLVLTPALALLALAVTDASGAGRSPAPSALTAGELQAKATNGPASSGVFFTEGVRLPYLSAGQGDFVLFLPDSADGLESWRPQVAAFGARFQAVAYLRRSEVAPNAPVAVVTPAASGTTLATSTGGRSQSSGRPSGSTTVDAGALRDLLMLVSSLTTGPVNVVGEGVGARLALRLALEYPERVRSLVLSAPDPHWFPRDAAVEAARTGATLPAGMDTMFACRKLWRVSVPVLVVSGERDPRSFGVVSPLRCIRSLRQQLVTGMSTRPHVHAADEFNRAVARFLERQRMTAGEP